MTTRQLAARLGVFARIFRRESVEDVAAAVAAAGYPLAHWNFAAIGHRTLAGDVDEEQFPAVRRAFAAAGITIPSVSATYNTAHPDPATRRAATREATRLIRLAPLLGADVVTLCSGTRDPEDMWRAHPMNTSAEAWSDLRESLEPLLEAAAEAGVRLGIEPEPGNLVADSQAAARLLRELGADAPVGIVLDVANLLSPATLPRQQEIIAAAVDLLGPSVISAQAKFGGTTGFSAASAGPLDEAAVFTQLARIPTVPLIVQDATEEEAGPARAALLRLHASHTAAQG